MIPPKPEEEESCFPELRGVRGAEENRTDGCADGLGNGCGPSQHNNVRGNRNNASAACEELHFLAHPRICVELF